MKAHSPEYIVVDDELFAETVESLSLPLKIVDDIHGSNSLMPCVLRVCNRVTDDILKEDLQHATGRDTLGIMHNVSTTADRSFVRA